MTRPASGIPPLLAEAGELGGSVGFKDSDGVYRGRTPHPTRPVEYVYFIQAVYGGAVKIGRAKRILRRLKGIQTGNPNDLRILYLYKTRDPARDERRVHKHFKDKHIRGEWYDITHKEIKALLGSDVYQMWPDNIYAHPATAAKTGPTRGLLENI
jgi:hypothetical protein